MAVIKFPGLRRLAGTTEPSKDVAAQAELFSFDGGSATSDDGEIGLLHAERPEGGEVYIAFPQKQFPLFVEAAAREMARAHKNGETKVSAFNCTGFAVNRTKADEILLTFHIGHEGHLNFLIPPDMPPALVEAMEIEIISDADDD